MTDRTMNPTSHMKNKTTIPMTRLMPSSAL